MKKWKRQIIPFQIKRRAYECFARSHGFARLQKQKVSSHRDEHFDIWLWASIMKYMVRLSKRANRYRCLRGRRHWHSMSWIRTDPTNNNGTSQIFSVLLLPDYVWYVTCLLN